MVECFLFIFLFLIIFFILNNIKKNTFPTLYYYFSKKYLHYIHLALSTIDMKKKLYFNKSDDMYFILNLIKNENIDKNIKIELIKKKISDIKILKMKMKRIHFN